MTRKIVVDARGARLGIGDRLAADAGIHRASNETRAVYELWIRHRTPGRLPRLADFYPLPIDRLQTATLVVQVLSDPADYLYTYVGALEAEARGYDPSGTTVRETFADEPEVLDFCFGNYVAATASSSGFIDFSIDATPNGRFLEMETLFLPCSEDGRSVTHIVVYSHYAEQLAQP